MKRNILACFGPKDGILSREEKMRQKKAKQTQEREQIFSRAAKNYFGSAKKVQTDLLTTSGLLAKSQYIFVPSHINKYQVHLTWNPT